MADTGFVPAIDLGWSFDGDEIGLRVGFEVVNMQLLKMRFVSFSAVFVKVTGYLCQRNRFSKVAPP